MPESRYGWRDSGEEIKAPVGWVILPEGSPIPQVHREFYDMENLPPWAAWAQPRRCHSTMTPLDARCWGKVRAFAIPETPAAPSKPQD